MRSSNQDQNIEPSTLTADADADVVCVQSIATTYLLKITDGTKVWKLVAPTPDAAEGHVRLALLPA